MTFSFTMLNCMRNLQKFTGLYFLLWMYHICRESHLTVQCVMYIMGLFHGNQAECKIISLPVINPQSTPDNNPIAVRTALLIYCLK